MRDEAETNYLEACIGSTRRIRPSRLNLATLHVWLRPTAQVAEKCAPVSVSRTGAHEAPPLWPVAIHQLLNDAISSQTTLPQALAYSKEIVECSHGELLATKLSTLGCLRLAKDPGYDVLAFVFEERKPVIRRIRPMPWANGWRRWRALLRRWRGCKTCHRTSRPTNRCH